MSVTRRRFIASVAAVPFAARLDAQSLLGSKPRVAVIGAGAFGGWTALELRKLGADVVLVDAWGPGNSLSSSGGKTRVIRAIYGPDRIYSEMVKRAFELWKTVDTSQDDPLYVEMGALWMHRGDDTYVRDSVPILHDLGFEVDQMTVAEAAKKYPQIDFNGVKSVWLEKKAGALSARHACVVVRDAFEKAGGRYRQSSVKPGTIASGKMSAVRLQDGSKVDADVYVFACGPWLGKLFPDVIGDRVHPTRQEVYYFATPKGSERYASSRLPIWIDFGKRIVYGIPDVNGKWLKVADDTRGEPIDPTTADRHPKKEKIESARQFLAERFPEIAKQPLLSAEVCQYENSPDGNLIVDRHPSASNVWLLGGGSGHGFKLSPVVGEMTAQAIVSGKEVPAVFQLERLRDIAKPKTQFDIKKSS
ncbi:MAG TPA: FAD-dependent oxidoreductase [Thermoanaerobaculia bacterium]|nr:FAD-dependent oxidoreductase [Thermoanaerobaculia bacterium]